MDVEVQLLGLNDFHGNLEPPTGSSGRILPAPGGTNVDAGGAAFLATHIRQMRATNANSLVVSAGDLIGASPLLSFHDEPTIEAMNEIGLDFNAVGNHEFDEGETELLRMQNGGCHPTDTAGTCKDADGHFDGANFEFLAANVVRRDTGMPMFPAYAIRKFGTIKVGFIGMTLEGTPDIVSPSGSSTRPRPPTATRASCGTSTASTPATSPGRSSTSSTGPTTPSTCSSPATRTSRTTASSTGARSRARARSAAW